MPASKMRRRYEIALYTNDGEEQWRATVSPADVCVASAARCSVPCPEEVRLAPGTAWFWELRTEGPLGTDTDRQAFRVASAEERHSFEAAVAAIQAAGEQELRDLLTAHVALRRDLLTEAETFARRYAEARPDDRAGRETLRYALTVRGVPEDDE